MTIPSRPADVAVFHPGTQHSWQTALALQDLGRLAWYATSIYYQPKRWPYRLERLPGSPGRRLAEMFQRFHQPRLDPARVRTAGVIEWLERIASRAGLKGASRRLDAVGNRRFAIALSTALREPGLRVAWGYNGSSAEAFAAAKAAGLHCLLDRTNGDFAAYNRMMDEVAAGWPDWFLPLERRIPAGHIARDRQEYDLADTIVCGSAFAAATIRAEHPAAADKLRVLPYCYDEELFAGLPAPQPRQASQPVRFLWVGLVIPRKGVHHALEAIAQLPANEASLTVVGQLGIPHETFARYADRVDYRGSVARSAIPAIMAEHDVLLFPSYFEGGGIVLYEALAAGLGIIQSDRADIAVSADTGLLLPELSTAAVLAAMREAIDDRARVASWRVAARRAARDHSFARYREIIGALLKDLGL